MESPCYTVCHPTSDGLGIVSVCWYTVECGHLLRHVVREVVYHWQFTPAQIRRLTDHPVGVIAAMACAMGQAEKEAA